MRCAIALAVLIFLPGSARAQFTGLPVTSIQFSPARQPMPDEELLRILPIKTGAILTADSVRDAIQKLYSTGRFQDIQVDGVADGAGVKLKFITTLTYFVGQVAVDGVPEPPSKGQLGTATKLQLGTPFVQNDLKQAVQNVQDRLRANGLYQATISSKTDRDDNTEQIGIDLSVDPGHRAHFDKVVITGDPKVSVDSLVGATGWQRGFSLFGLPAIGRGLLGWRTQTQARLDSGIEKVLSRLQKGDRLLSKVTLEKLDYDQASNTVTPTLRVDSGPRVLVHTSGTKVSKGRLKQLIPIYQERSVDRTLLNEGKRNLLEYFQSQGYFDADVDFELLPEQDNRQVINFQIERNDRSKLVNLEISGNRYFDTPTLRERMYVRPASFLRFRNGRYSVRLLNKDIDSIEELYRSNGFRDVQVLSSVEEDFGGKSGDLGVRLQVNEGPQWFVSKLELEGANDEDKEQILSTLLSNEGQPYSELNVATDRDAILNYYYNRGYLDAIFDWSQTSADIPTRVNLKFTVRPGRQQFVRGVLVGGLETTNRTLVDNRISLVPGDPVSQARIGDSQRRLYDLGIFAKVQTAVQNPDGEEESKFILYQIDEARRYSLNVGVGAELARIGGGSSTSFDSPAGATGFSPRVSLGVSRLNFLGLGHTIGVQGRVSSLQQRALISYLAPQFLGDDKFNFSINASYDQSQDVRTYSSRRLEGSIQLQQRISRSDSLQYRITFRRASIDPNSLRIDPGLVPLLAQPDRVLVGSTTFIRDRRDDPADSHSGSYSTADVGFAKGLIASEANFTRVAFRNSTYYRIGKSKDLVFARTLNFGYIQRVSGGRDIPLPERFFAGGSNSHRAFPDNQAGPRDLKTGFPLGGSAQLFNSLELRFPLIGDNLGGVIFHDAGNVYSDIRSISFRFRQHDLSDFNYMVQSAGFGIRYRTPIGPLRLDFSLSPNSPRFFGFKGSREDLINGLGQQVNQRINVFQFHFSLGQAF
ncbi:MAG: outer membrane protein assembly factor BamA [Bryobacteraceae bacterium]